eukprot:Nitzschia sp. Nitz4//scaffold337_size18511//17307//18401//NITZ4_008785-RA/size18511-processed-gene-0.15-mRNA-1//-1//CDS//3329548325//61//frame0
MLTDEECEQILSNYETMAQAAGEERSRTLTERLSVEELEQAALRSYAYFITSQRKPETLTPQIRFATAMRESSRHLVGIDSVEEAHKLLLATLDFHQDKQTLLYRTCMQSDFPYANPQDAALAATRRERIIKESKVQPMIVRGQDRERNAVWITMPRTCQGEDPDAFVDLLIFTIERCAATTESLTLGTSDKFVAVLDCNRSSSPTIKAMQMGIGALENFYPGRLKNLIVLDLNYVLQGIYNIVKPFLDPSTKEKFLIVKGKAKEPAVKLHIDEDQAQPNCLKAGQLSLPIDGEWFVKEIPFCRLYDYVPQHKSTPTTRKKTHTDKRIPAPVRSPRTFRSKVQTLAVGSMTRCMRHVTVTPLPT